MPEASERAAGGDHRYRTDSGEIRGIPSFVERSGALTKWGDALVDWHGSVAAKLNPNRDLAARAALRRTQTVEDVFLDAIAPMERLRRRLGLAAANLLGIERLALVAMAVAEIDENRPDLSLGAVLAGHGTGKAPVSLARVRLLLATEEPDLFVRLLRGLMPLINRRAPVAHIGETVRQWTSPFDRPRARRRLMLDYIEIVPDNVLNEEPGRGEHP